MSEEGDPSAAPSGPAAVISVCISCRSEGEERPGEALLAALRARLPPGDAQLVVRPVQCLSVCKRPCTAAISGPDRYTYVFGDLEPESGAAALLEAARTFADLEHGFMLWRERPEALRRGIVARVPPPGWEGEDGAHPR